MSSFDINVTNERIFGEPVTGLIEKLNSCIGRPDPSDNSHRAFPNAKSLYTTHKPNPLAGLRTYLPKEIGEGYWDFIEISPGIVLSITDSLYYSPHQLEYLPEWKLKIRVIYSGSISLLGEDVVYAGETAHVHINNSGKSTGYTIHPNLPLKMVTLSIVPNIENSLPYNTNPPTGSFRTLFEAAKLKPLSFPIESCTKTMQIAKEIIESRDKLPLELRVIYIKAKAQELICAAFPRFIPELNISEHKGKIKQRDLNRLHEAKFILESQLEKPPTIDKLSKMVGISRSKLTSSFKECFGETIHEYQTKYRMNEAKRLLEETDLPLSEISLMTGFQHASNFTQAIKQYFGENPKGLRNNS
ncbi:AraC family transcriptional regulator [Porticoccaceae bacterium LTM1]|nr:AraC family transcriptional regulator [Porticoccaceae bacterium LTM1]